MLIGNYKNQFLINYLIRISDGLSPLISPGVFQEQVAKANQRAYHEVQKAKLIGNGNVQMGKKSIEQSKLDEKRHNINMLLSEVLQSLYMH